MVLTNGLLLKLRRSNRRRRKLLPKMRHQNPNGKTAKVAYPSDELRDVFYQVGTELEKAFTIAARETQAAFKKVSENVQQKTAPHKQARQHKTDAVICPNCGAKNVSGAIFCHTCGKRIVPEAGWNRIDEPNQNPNRLRNKAAQLKNHTENS